MSALRSTRPEANSAFISEANSSQSVPSCLHDRVEERADAGAVAGQDDLVRPAVPDAERELPLDVVEHLLAVLLPQVRDEFGVGVGAEDVALRFQLRPLLGVVVRVRR